MRENPHSVKTHFISAVYIAILVYIVSSIQAICCVSVVKTTMLATLFMNNRMEIYQII